jgi:hypothetical protein
MSTNSHELAARLKKARKIADVLAANGYRSHTVAGFTEEQRGLAASAARQNRPSDETWAVVVKMLREREGVREMAR